MNSNCWTAWSIWRNHPRVIELGCGAAQLSRKLLERFAASEVTALEVDERQHAKNLTHPQAGLRFVQAGAQAIPFDDGVLRPGADAEVAAPRAAGPAGRRAGRGAPRAAPGGLLYVSEPVFAGALNEVMRVFHDEEVVRAAALAALHRAWPRAPGSR